MYEFMEDGVLLLNMLLLNIDLHLRCVLKVREQRAVSTFEVFHYNMQELNFSVNFG